MNNFKASAKKNFDEKNRRLRNNSGENSKPFMYPATCTSCAEPCQIPFKPTEGRPVYCSNCFALQQNNDSQIDTKKSFKSDFSSHKQKFQAECHKCGKNCEVPFRPLPGKKVFCSECFDKDINAGVKNIGQINDQFVTLNAKLDKILEILDAKK